jgi:hypothetical protein
MLSTCADTRALNGFQAQELLVDANDNAFVIGRIFNDSGFPASHDIAVAWAGEINEPSLSPITSFGKL